MHLDLTADLGQKIVIDAALDQRIADAAMGGLIRYRRLQIETAENHEVQPHLQRALQLRVAQPVPLANQQAFEQNQRIIALWPDPREPQTALQDRRPPNPKARRSWRGHHPPDPICRLA